MFGDVGQPDLVGAGAVKFRCARSSWTAGPGRLGEDLRPFFFVVDQIRCSEQSRQTRRSPTLLPARSSSSEMKRYPNSGSSSCTSRMTFTRWASS